MNGFLGTSASLWSDLSLTLTLILGAVAAFGGIQARKKRLSTHCPVMAVAAILNWVPALVVMIPTWLGGVNSGGLGRIPLIHGVLGSATQLLMTYTVIRMYWYKQLPPDRPLWLMRVTMILWLMTLVGGTAVYLALYVL